jgi:hypothetical protein
MINDDEKYKSLRDTLKSLPRVRAKSDFEARLLNRIKESEKGTIHAPVKPIKEPVFKNWLASLLRPSLVPAMGLTVVLLITVVVYFGYFAKMNDTQSTKEQMVASTNQGELIIYVKEDREENFSENYPKEYSAITPSDSRSERDAAPLETPTDFLSRPESPKPIEGYIKPDRVSEEQKIEMQRSFDKDEKGVDVKGERKSDDVIMKKESKTEPKKEMEKGESPYNIKDEKKNENINTEDGIYEQKIENQQPEVKEKAEEKTDSKKEGKDSSRISRTLKDSTKSKDTNKILDDKEKDSQK